MECKKCGNILPENAKFCFECGAKVEQDLICATCGAKMSVGYKFCIECGTVISGSDENIIENEVSGLEIEEVDWDKLLTETTNEEDMHQKLSKLMIADEDKYFSKEEAKQFIRNFLEIVEWKEERDLGGERYIVKVPMSDEFRQKYFILNAILNMNNVEAFTKDDNVLYFSFYNDMIYDIDSIIQMMFNLDILTPVHGRYDWISSCVDDEIFCLKTAGHEKESSIYCYGNQKKTSYREYKEVSVIDAVTGEIKGDIEAQVKIHSFEENECRIIICFSKYNRTGFYIFDEKGKLILKKLGDYSCRCGNKRFAELSYRGEACNGRFNQIGLYDEITGVELVPIQYDYVSIWKKNDGSILAVGVPEILDFKKEIDYYEYDFRKVSKISCKHNIYPTSADVCDESSDHYGRRGINIWMLNEKLESLGYEEIELIAI